MLTRRDMMAGTAALPTIKRAAAQAQPTIRIGMLQDASGANSILGGRLSMECARQAILDQAGTTGLKADLISADHRNSPDLGMSIARQWINDGIDAVMEFNNSAVALGINTLIRDSNRVMLANNVGAAALSGQSCTPNMTHWTFDTAMLARVVGNALCDQGGDTWFFIRADYAFGRSMQADTVTVVERSGGKVLGSIPVPFPNDDFSAALLQAQSSGAKVVGLAEAGLDMVNCLKQAAEFGIAKRGQRLAALILFINDVHAVGLPVAQGLVGSNTFYWDLNDRTRAFAKRVWSAMGNAPPNMCQAGNYSAVMHYLKSAAALGAADAKKSGLAAVNWMKAHKVQDDAIGEATIRVDGVAASPAFLCEVKKPEESKYPWDYFRVLATTPGDKAWRPLSEGGCPLAS